MVIAENHRSAIDTMATDVIMPEMNGCELSRRLQAQRPEIRVLYLSGYTPNSLASCGILEPGTSLLEKPFTPDGLARKVREVLDAASMPSRD